MGETIVVALILAATILVTHGRAIEWVGSAAVLCGFGHASVSERLAEQEAMRARPSVPCHRKLIHYFVAKEILWCVYFVALGAWSALAGVAVFLAYPVWRRWWRRRRSLERIPC
jgi:hypothetical protein